MNRTFREILADQEKASKKTRFGNNQKTFKELEEEDDKEEDNNDE